MLLHLLRWLRKHTEIDFDLLLRSGGDLVPDYRGVCTVFEVSGAARSWQVHAVLNGLSKWSGRRRFHLPVGLGRILRRRQIGLIYSNTLTNSRMLAALPLACPVVCHVHEVESYIQRMDTEDIAAMRQRASMFIVVSETMRQSLARRGIEPDRIATVPGFASLGEASAPDARKRAAFRRQHGIPENAVLVGGCGTPHWQKGPDLLVHIARMLTGRAGGEHLHFAWVGGREQDLALLQLRWDVERAGLAGSFSVIPHLADPVDYFDSLDILAMVSRDDPLPLVAIEAGAHGVPVVCFEGSAGFLDRECGVIVPYLDLQGYAGAIRELADDGARRARLGERLAARIRERHDVPAGASRIAGIIRPFVRVASPP
jgi:glycosyltransferase involved in cell wall biosynthesis